MGGETLHLTVLIMPSGAEAAKVLNEQQLEEEAIYLIPYPLHNEHFSGEHFGFEYLYQGAAPSYILAATTPHHLAKKVETILSTDTNFSSVTFLDWNNELVGGDARAEEHTVALLEKTGRLSNSQKYGSFELHTFTDITTDRPWSYYERLHPLTIHYDKGISLLGFALGQGRAPAAGPAKCPRGKRTTHLGGAAVASSPWAGNRLFGVFASVRRSRRFGLAKGLCTKGCKSFAYKPLERG